MKIFFHLQEAEFFRIFYYIDFNREPTLKTLVNPSTETVIGIERCARIIENKDSIFETSYFKHLTKLFGLNALTNEAKIISDHVKTLIFLFSEVTILPKKRDRGRIIRSLTRNLLTSCYLLKLKPSEFLPQLVDEVISTYQKTYPELVDAKQPVLEIILNHETKYLKTLVEARSKIHEFLSDMNNQRAFSDVDREFIWHQYGVPDKLLPLLMTDGEFNTR